MTLRRIIAGIVVLALLGVGWVGYMVYVTWKGIPDAYAAWDAGTLVIEYLETHDRQWPRSWEELYSAADTLEDHGRHLYGAGGSVYGDLHDVVAVDWEADVRAIAAFDWNRGKLRVITRADGTDFPVVWEGAEPNEMVWSYLNKRPDGKFATSQH